MTLAVLEIDCRWSTALCDWSLPKLPETIQQRAARYLSAESRRNLIASRSRLREVLELLGLDQDGVAVADNGRPYHQHQSVQFNLSHSQDRAVLIVSLDGDLIDGLGVDVESTLRTVDVVAIGRRFFTSEEHAWVGSDPSRFFHVWTRKEAILKTNGVGLRVELDSFDVLTDRVSTEVIGRPLTVKTISRDEGYLISWSAVKEPDRLVIVSDREPDWQHRLLRALKE